MKQNKIKDKASIYKYAILRTKSASDGDTVISRGGFYESAVTTMLENIGRDYVIVFDNYPLAAINLKQFSSVEFSEELLEEDDDTDNEEE